ncbi:uncharacterized protein LOC143242163 [Tachypleus tridentatus]|uniref:uncharacterized protein LOC143242163 n=1 Tax=Tachypleus tridentatus TaxID=6853 RepID=UPI003FD5B678
MAFKFNFPAPCHHVSGAEQENCEEACEGRICPSEGKVPINRGGETVSPMDTSGVNRISICIGSRNMSLHYSKSVSDNTWLAGGHNGFSRSTSGGSWFVGLNRSTETSTINNVLNSAVTTVDVSQTVGSKFVSVSVSSLPTAIGGPEWVNNVVVEGVVTKVL